MFEAGLSDTATSLPAKLTRHDKGSMSLESTRFRFPLQTLTLELPADPVSKFNHLIRFSTLASLYFAGYCTASVLAGRRVYERRESVIPGSKQQQQRTE